MITSMTGNNIFVYGSNPEFRNGFGAALTAREFGAKRFGGGRGIVGNTFGLITKNLKAGYIEEATGIVYASTGYRSVPLEMISANIDELYQCAADNLEKTFFLAYIYNGRNLNGYSSLDMWNLFTKDKNVPSNIRFHESFKILVKDNGEHSGFTFFFRSTSPYSQWYPSIFTINGVTFSSAEQCMMYCKAKLFKDEYIAQKILDLNKTEYPISNSISGSSNCSEPSILKKFIDGGITKEDILSNKKNKEEWDGFQKKIKALGRKVSDYNEALWVKHRVSYVSRSNYEKFTQNLDIKEILLSTGGTRMTECNPFDRIWSCGLREDDPRAKDPSKWVGLDLLGEVLTNLKRWFQEELAKDLVVSEL